MTQAQHLNALRNEQRQVEVAQLAMEENLSAGELSRLCSSLARNPNIDASQALHHTRRGEPVDAIRMAISRETVAAPLLQATSREDAEGSDADLWEEVERTEPTRLGDDPRVDTTTASGNRRFRIRSLDSRMNSTGFVTARKRETWYAS